MTMIELIDALVDANLDGSNCDEGSTAEQFHAAEAVRIHAEIERRLFEVKSDFKGTEAVRINMILDCGSDAGWRS